MGLSAIERPDGVAIAITQLAGNDATWIGSSNCKTISNKRKPPQKQD
jgi:hypothetical protein